MAHHTDAVADVVLDAIAHDLTETDALTANDGETLHPDYYVVDAENLTYLVSTVLSLAEQRHPATPFEALRTAVESFVVEAEQGANAFGACSHEWVSIKRLRAILDAATGVGDTVADAQEGVAAEDDAPADVAADPQAEATRSIVAEALRQSWLAVHIERFAHDEGTAGGPDNFYNGMLHARKILDDRAAATLDGTLPIPSAGATVTA